MSWKAFLFLLVFCAGLNVVGASVMASQSMEMPNCYFSGVVQDISVRKEPGRGLSKGLTYTYIDVTVGHIKADGDDTGYCSVDDVQTYQMRETEKVVPKVGQCIQAFSNFSGDGNFMSGNWLTVESLLPEGLCEVSESSE